MHAKIAVVSLNINKIKSYKPLVVPIATRISCTVLFSCHKTLDTVVHVPSTPLQHQLYCVVFCLEGLGLLNRNSLQFYCLVSEWDLAQTEACRRAFVRLYNSVTLSRCEMHCSVTKVSHSVGAGYSVALQK
jgi:hypothetical protein